MVRCFFGGEGGIDDAHPCTSPLRGRVAVQIGCPADLSNRWVRTFTLLQKNGPFWPAVFGGAASPTLTMLRRVQANSEPFVEFVNAVFLCDEDAVLVGNAL